MQPNYFENFIQSIFNTIGDLSGKVFVVGGDGRYYNDVAIQKFVKMAAANGVAKLIIGQNGFLSTPASSNLLLKTKPTAASFSPHLIIPEASTPTSESNMPTKPAVRFRRRSAIRFIKPPKTSANTKSVMFPTWICQSWEASKSAE